MIFLFLFKISFSFGLGSRVLYKLNESMQRCVLKDDLERKLSAATKLIFISFFIFHITAFIFHIFE